MSGASGGRRFTRRHCWHGPRWARSMVDLGGLIDYNNLAVLNATDDKVRCPGLKFGTPNYL
eukprot:SAG31_NODE_3895_length_3773_cov_21.681818_9_plen_61_part_00